MEVITSHSNADFDAIASMVAAQKLYPQAALVLPVSLEKTVRSAFVPAGRVFTLSTGHDFYKVKDIEPALVTRIILVDVHSTARIGPLADAAARPGVEVHIYDHHPASKGDLRGSLEVVRPYGASTTVLVEVLREKSLPISSAEATLFMAGIYEDTGNLTYPSTTVTDLETAAFLLSKGADLSTVSDMLKRELTPEEVSFLNEILKSCTTVTYGGHDIVIAQGVFTHHTGDISVLAHKTMDIEGMDTLFMLVDSGDRVHVVARSRSSGVDVGRVLKEMGGGGHAHAASATLKDVTLTEARDRLLGAIKKGIASVQRARDIMSFPPITVESNASMQSVAAILGRYNINAIPVVERGVFKGVITRQTIDKAMYHGLGDAPVCDFMTIETECVDPETPVEDIREMFIRHGQRLIPVVSGSRVEGVITRTDILRLLQREVRGDRPRVKMITKLMRDRLPMWLVEKLRSIGEVAEDMGCRAYVVGGFVRDLLLGRENLDVDIVIEGGDGIAFARAYASKMKLRVRSHKRFRTAVLIFPDGFKIDVATARLEYYESPGALPTVEQSSLKLDIYRRDFIINTLAVELNPGGFGTLIDFFGGQRDIKEKKIRVLHNLSFIEDPTRAFRAVRFSVKFGFTIEPHTRNLIKKALGLGVFRHLSGPRILEELRSILREDTALKAIKGLKDLGLLAVIDQEITLDETREALFERARDVIGWHRLLYTGDEAEGWLVLFLVLTDCLSEARLRALVKRLSISGRKTVEIILMRRQYLQALRRLARSSPVRSSDLYRLLDPLPREGILYMMAKTTDEEVRKGLSAYITRLRTVKPELTGADLIAMGMEQGPEVGRVLRALRCRRLDGKITSRDEEAAFVRRYLKRRARREAAAPAGRGSGSGASNKA